MLPSHRVTTIEVQLRVKYGCLQAVQPAVVANQMMFVFLQAAVIAQSAHRCRSHDCWSHCATVATPSFRWIKAEAGNVAHRADRLAVVSSAVRLRGIR